MFIVPYFYSITRGYAKDVYKRQAYCNVMNISDREAAVGVHVNDLMKNSGTAIHAMKSTSNKYKMFDVLENGRKVLDWEVTVESRSNSADTLSVSNNIYPIFTDDDEIDGVLEFLYLNKLNLNKVNKIIAVSYTHLDVYKRQGLYTGPSTEPT